MQEQMIETRARKKNSGMHIDLDKHRLCGKCVEKVIQLASGCQMLAAMSTQNDITML